MPIIQERKCAMSDTYIIAGGDMRFSALAEQLGDKHRVYTVGFDKNVFTSDKITVADNVMSVPHRCFLCRPRRTALPSARHFTEALYPSKSFRAR